MKPLYLKFLQVLYYLWNIGLFIYAGILLLKPHVVIASSCFLVALLLTMGLFFLPRSIKRGQRIPVRELILDGILIGIFIVVLAHGAGNILFILFGISLLLGILIRLCPVKTDD